VIWFNEKYILLEDELEYIEHYRYIIHCKYESKIGIDINVPSELLKCYIPKMLVQPIMENAVIHGVAPMLDNGMVWLTASKEEDYLVLKIEDNGIGMRSDILRNVRKNAHEQQTSSINASQSMVSHQMAIKNIQNRLNILYGQNYSFEIDSKVYGGTCVSFRIPFQTKEDSL